MNYIVYCLYGNDAKYINGISENARLCQYVYGPEWMMTVAIPMDYVIQDNVHFHKCSFLKIQNPFVNPKAIRYMLANAITVNGDRVVFRDADSRINYREKAAVDAWIESGLPFHSMHDHPSHSYLPMPGMWGMITGHLDLKSLVQSWAEWRDVYGNDNIFASKIIGSQIKDRCLIHDDSCRFPKSVPFPDVQIGRGFVGEIILADNQPNPGDREVREKFNATRNSQSMEI